MAEPQDIIAIGPDGVENHFPLGTTDAQISAALGAIPEANKSAMPNAPTWKAIGATSAAQGAKFLANATAEFGTNPSVPANAAKVGRVIGAVTSLPAGLSGFGDVSKGAYAGGRSGWFTGKLLQDVARPASTALETVAPYVSAIGGAANMGQLAQIAEPNRKDIGFLGIGPTDHTASDQASVMRMQIQNLVNSGLSLNDAIRRVSDAWRPR